MFHLQHPEPVVASGNSKHEIHVSARQEYPAAEPLPLPINIDPTESTRFSPQRARDITSTAIAANIWNRVDITMDTTNDRTDPHVESYDCTGAVSLNSSMQSNVPSPFGGMHKFTHLNMPGGQWEQSSKWMSHDLNSSHYMNLRREARKNWTRNDVKGTVSRDTTDKGSTMHRPLATPLLSSTGQKIFSNAYCASKIHQRFYAFSLFDRMNATTNHDSLVIKRNFSGKQPNSSEADVKEKNAESNTDPTLIAPSAAPLSGREKLKRAVKDYGTTVVVFHVAISLASLGFFYQVVARYVRHFNFPYKRNAVVQLVLFHETAYSVSNSFLTLDHLFSRKHLSI